MRPVANKRGSALKHDARFWSRVNIPSESACWEWTGSKNRRGYGKHGVNYKHVTAHRYAYAWKYGHPGKMFVCHKCDNPACCNPSHLFLGTLQDNLRDMVQKMRHCHGERANGVILTEGQVREIREKYIPYKYSTVRLAKEYGVTQSAVWLIISGRNWKYLK